MDQEDLIKIGEVAKILHRHRLTVIDYEDRGLLPPALREPLTQDRMWDRAVVEELAEQLRASV